MEQLVLRQQTAISNSSLKTKTTQIIKKLNSVNTSIFESCKILNEIKKTELYKKDNINTFTDYVVNVIGISKSKASKMCKISEKFIENENEVLNLAKQEYTESQLAELVIVDDDDVYYLLESGKLHNMKTVKEIRKAVKELKDVIVIDENQTDDEIETEPENEIDEPYTDDVSTSKRVFTDFNEFIAFMNGLDKSIISITVEY